MKKYGKDFLFCGALCLGSFVIPFLLGWFFEEITTSEEVGSAVMIILMTLCGTFSAVLSVFKGKHFLIYPATNVILTLFLTIMAAISIVTDIGGYAGVNTDGTDLDFLGSLFTTTLSAGLIIGLIGVALVFAIGVSLGALLVSFIAKLVYDNMKKRTENVVITENEGT